MYILLMKTEDREFSVLKCIHRLQRDHIGLRIPRPRIRGMWSFWFPVLIFLPPLFFCSPSLPPPPSCRSDRPSRSGGVRHCKGYTKERIRTALGPYGRSIPRNIGPPYGRCVSLISSDPCTPRLPPTGTAPRLPPLQFPTFKKR